MHDIADSAPAGCADGAPRDDAPRDGAPLGGLSTEDFDEIVAREDASAPAPESAGCIDDATRSFIARTLAEAKIYLETSNSESENPVRGGLQAIVARTIADAKNGLNTAPVPAAPKCKRGPGRPSTKPTAPRLEKCGVVDSPKDPGCRLELAYEEPMVFKSLFAYFNNIQARELHVRCRPDGITFFTRDHKKLARVVASIVGRHLNWYYCEGEFWIGINKVSVQNIFASIDKSCTKISMRQTHENPSSLAIIFKDFSIDKESSYEISVSDFQRDEDLFAAEEVINPATILDRFPVEFTLTAKQLRKSINDANRYNDKATFERIGRTPLTFTYTKPNLNYREDYLTDEKIHLRSSIEPDQIFRCTIDLPSTKSIILSMVTEDVRVLCSQTGNIVFRSAFDEKALVMNTISEVL